MRQLFSNGVLLDLDPGGEFVFLLLLIFMACYHDGCALYRSAGLHSGLVIFW